MTAQRDAVRGFLRRFVQEDALVEDLTQETFLRAQRTTSKHRGEASERSWLCAIALNLVRDHFRDTARKATLPAGPDILDRLSSEDDPERNVLEAEMASCIGEFVLKLPHPQGDVVALHDAAGLKHPEIASLLGVSAANSRVLLHRGRAALREILGQNCILSLGGDDIPCERRPPIREQRS